MTKLTKLTIAILAIWLAIVALSATLSFVTASTKPTEDLQLMVDASTLNKQCQQAIKQYKIDHGYDTYPLLDKFDTGMLGIPSTIQFRDYYSTLYGKENVSKVYLEQAMPLLAITTTSAELFAKRTSCDPNWAGYMISLYRRADLKAGDQIGMTFSGSFPALNIAALVSAEVYGLQICAMTGIGASYCGANDPRFTFFEMQNYLCDIGLLTHRIDYVSWGGNDDILKDVNAYEDEAQPHLQRIQSVIDNSTATYIREENFDANIDLRISYFQQDIPQIKMFINVGGSMAGVGTGLNVYQQTGYSKGGMVYSSNKRAHNQGLLQYYKACGLPVVNMLNIRQLAHTFNVPYADDNMEVAPQIGLTDYNKQNQYYSFYYQKAYNPVYAVVALSLSVGLAIFYVRYRKNYAPTQQHESYNHIMRNHH